MLRLLLAGVACLSAARVASARPHLYVGFFDDQAFRWQAGRQENLELASREGATIVRTVVDWALVAPWRPRRPADPFAPEYRLDDLDELVANAQERGLVVLLTIWGTPAWANGGAGANVAPTHLADLRDFAHALASRYSGRYRGLPMVRFFSVWNEPNSAVFLSPQFDAAGRPVAPRTYAGMVAAGYAGIKSANPAALVAAGETAARGSDRPHVGVHDSESPTRFAQLVAAAAPGLRFDAWAHHPYPANDLAPPDAPQAWPAVGLSSLGRFESELARLFRRRRVPLWLREFGYRTSPQIPGAAPYALQASYLSRALALARSDADVQMFIWFRFRDQLGQRWESGVVDRGGHAKPALTSFAVAADCYRLTVDPCVQAGAKLAVLNGSNSASVGNAVAVSADGTTALVGARDEDAGAGAAWVFTRSGGRWIQEQKLTPSDESGAGSFGRSVALSADGKTTLIGAVSDGNDAGAAWIFTRSGTTWTQVGGKLTAPGTTGVEKFGDSVALSADGTTALIGAPSDNGSVGAA
jgi:hypothetical protein